MSGGPVPSGASLAAETGESQGEESRLKAGCSQDWLPHKAGRSQRLGTYAQVSPHPILLSSKRERNRSWSRATLGVALATGSRPQGIRKKGHRIHPGERTPLPYSGAS